MRHGPDLTRFPHGPLHAPCCNLQSIVHVINKVLLPPLNETVGWAVPIANATAAGV